MEEIYEIGTLVKGDACVVFFPDGRKPWLCRVAASLTYDSKIKSLYECITPHGSVVVTGAVWVKPMSEEEKKSLVEVEHAARLKGLDPYKGRIRVGDTT